MWNEAKSLAFDLCISCVVLTTVNVTNERRPTCKTAAVMSRSFFMDPAWFEVSETVAYKPVNKIVKSSSKSLALVGLNG